MRKDVTLKSNALIQGTRRPAVSTLRMVGYMAGNKIAGVTDSKAACLFPRVSSWGAGYSTIQVKRERGYGLDITAHWQLQWKGLGEGLHCGLFPFPGITLLGWLSSHSIWGVTASQPLPFTEYDSECSTALDKSAGLLPAREAGTFYSLRSMQLSAFDHTQNPCGIPTGRYKTFPSPPAYWEVLSLSLLLLH